MTQVRVVSYYKKTGKNWGIRKLKESCTTGADCSNSWMSVQAVAKTSNSSQDSSKIYQRLSNIVKELQSSRRKINHRLPMLQCSPKKPKDPKDAWVKITH